MFFKKFCLTLFLGLCLANAYGPNSSSNEINKAIMGQPSLLTLQDFDVYVDSNYTIYVVDIRNF